MEPSQYLAAIRRRWVSVLAITLLVFGAAVAYTATRTEQYQATVSVFLSLSRGDTAGELVQGSAYAQNLVDSYARIASMPIVLEPVIAELGLDVTASQLSNSLQAGALVDTVLIEITATRPTATGAADLANAVAEQLGETVTSLTPTQTDEDQAVRIAVVEPATVPTAPAFPPTRRNLAAGLLVGLALGITWALLRELLDTKIRTESDVTRITAAPLVGVIGQDRGTSLEGILRGDVRSHRVEAYRRMRTNIEYLNYEGQIRSIVVTSPLPGEGKSTTATNVAMRIAEAGKEVLLVDGDLRRPVGASRLGLVGTVGLSTVLSGRVELEDAIQATPQEHLHFLAAGEPPPNPSELLGSPRMRRLLHEDAQAFDYVIVDSSPALPVTDPVVLAQVADAVLVVVSARKTHRSDLEQMLKMIDQPGVGPIGVVLNNVKVGSSTAYDYYDPGEQRKASRRVANRAGATPRSS